MENKQEEEIFDPNEFMKSHDKVMRYICDIENNNGSTELDEEGSPKYRNFSKATMRLLMFVLAQCSSIRVITPQFFLFKQGDITEEQFHSKVQELMDSNI